MQAAEGSWQVEEGQETENPLTYQELIALRRGEKVTVVEHYLGGRSEVFRASVTSNRPYGYTDLRGLWVCELELPAWSREALRELTGRTAANLVPCHVLCFKEKERDLRLRYRVGCEARQVYRGWTVEPQTT